MRLARYRPRLPLVVALALAAAAIAWWSPSDAQVPNPSDVADDGFAPGEVIVGFEEGALSGQSTDALLAGASVADRSESLGAERVVLPPGVSVEQAISELQDAPGVAFVEPNYLLHASAEPNDPLYPRQQFNLDVIGAPAAWDTNTDASGAILAIIDTGVDLEHEDLAGQLWTNPNEIPGDGIDNDHNGCPDDVHGCNFISPSIGDSCGYQALPPHSDVRDDAAHGTRVAGIAAAAGDNGIGIAGMGWQGRLMIIKAMDCEKSGSSFDVARAIDYAVANKASIINLSLGGSGRSEMLIQAIDRATNAGVLLVAATGNLGPQVNFPANLPNVLAVGASGAFDAPDSRAPFSNWGPEVDVVAPGIDVLSTAPIVAASHLAPNQSLLVAAQPPQPQRLNVVVEDR
ncbi:MAG TPA: S8 family serine peptidase, partial [Dehalococcoidia bacterium]|nr:S8 family serine peptidase [Dehalococcoidia bacterium]